MSDSRLDNVERVAEVIRRHEFSRGGETMFGRYLEHCVCGWQSTFQHRQHSDHVADEVLKALGLTEECGYGDAGEDGPDGWFSKADGVDDSRATALKALTNGRALFSRLVSVWREEPTQ